LKYERSQACIAYFARCFELKEKDIQRPEITGSLTNFRVHHLDFQNMRQIKGIVRPFELGARLGSFDPLL
jgi:hypothetical protein